jgi:hypothetical protein
MRDFSKVSPTVWRSKKFRSLSAPAQFAFFALLAGDVAKEYHDLDACVELENAGLIKWGDGEWVWVDPLGCVPAPKGHMTGIARKWIARTIRLAVYARDGFACVYCGRKDKLQLDHVEAVSRGGTDEAENLVTACKYCNASKGTKTPQQWEQSRAVI